MKTDEKKLARPRKSKLPKKAKRLVVEAHQLVGFFDDKLRYIISIHQKVKKSKSTVIPDTNLESCE